MQLVLIILTFLLTVILVVAIGSFLDKGRGKVQDRLAGISKMSIDADPEDILKMPFMQRVVSPALIGIGHFFGRVAPGEIRSRVDKRIIHAGNPWNLNFFSLLAVQILVGGLVLLLSLFLFRLLQVGAVRMWFVIMLLTLVGFYLPYFIVSSKADSRQQVIRRALPDVLDLLLVSVEAGLGFDMAMKKVTQQMPGPLSAEIKSALDEIRMGGSREGAFRGIARRSGVSELSSFISSIIQAEQLGSNIANTLRVQSEFMRQKRRQRAEEMATKAPVKLIFPLIIFIFPALFVVIVGPAVIRVFYMFLSMN
jgi:tight adherence protein C